MHKHKLEYIDDLFASKRTEYNTGELLEEELDSIPLLQFQKWLTEAYVLSNHEPNAMVLSTVGRDRRPYSGLLEAS